MQCITFSRLGDLRSIPGLETSLGEGKGYPLQHSGLENSMDCSPCIRKDSDMTERLSLSQCITFSRPAYYT